MRRIRSLCCARAASGHAAAPLRSVMKWRRFTINLADMIHTRRAIGLIACYCTGAPIATGRTGEPASPCARSGRIMVHDSHTLS
jgi:hypothetical protein